MTLPNRWALQGKKNHENLKYFLEQKLSSKEQQKWIAKM